MEKYLTIKQVAELLSLTPLTVWKKVREGVFTAYQIKGSRQWRVTETDFFNFERTYRKYGKKKVSTTGSYTPQGPTGSSTLSTPQGPIS